MAPQTDFIRDALNGARTVTELGPWEGDLAAFMLTAHPTISPWTGYDICSNAIRAGCQHPRYRPTQLTKHPWDTNLQSADVFIASHVLEHISSNHLEQLVPQFGKYGRLYLDVPIPEIGATDWTGYSGSHILNQDWDWLHALLTNQGFALTNKSGTARLYGR